MFCVYIFNFKLKIILKNCIISNSLKMVTKKRGRYEVSDKGKMIHELARCHLTPLVKGVLEKNNIKLKVVKPGLTNLIQPADVVLFAVFKTLFGNKWNDWYLNAPKSLTYHGNIEIKPEFAL